MQEELVSVCRTELPIWNVYKNTEPLCCTPETNKMLYVNYSSIIKKKERYYLKFITLALCTDPGIPISRPGQAYVTRMTFTWPRSLSLLSLLTLKDVDFKNELTSIWSTMTDLIPQLSKPSESWFWARHGDKHTEAVQTPAVDWWLLMFISPQKDCIEWALLR